MLQRVVVCCNVLRHHSMTSCLTSYDKYRLVLEKTFPRVLDSCGTENSELTSTNEFTWLVSIEQAILVLWKLEHLLWGDYD